jgi:hypothetical protein
MNSSANNEVIKGKNALLSALIKGNQNFVDIQPESA